MAALGDNLRTSARCLAATIGLSENHTAALDELGRMLNYNAYGDSTDDLHVAPQTLYGAVHLFVDPLDFIADSPRCSRQLSAMDSRLSEGPEAAGVCGQHRRQSWESPMCEAGRV